MGNKPLRGVSLATCLVLLAALLSIMTASSASAVEPPPAPTKIDRSGSDQDEFVIPDVDDIYYGYNGRGVFAGPNSTGGAKVVVIETYDNRTGDYGPSFTLNYNTGVTSTEAPYQHRVTVLPGTCQPSTGMTRLSGGIYNPSDSTGRYADVDMWFIRYDGGGSFLPLQGKKVLDGETRMLGSEQLRPGTYRVEVNINRGPTVILKPDIFIPKCGNEVPPPNTGGGTHSSAKPKGNLHQVRRTNKMAVTTINRKVPNATIFKVIVDPRRGKTTVKTIKVASNKVTKKVYRSKVGTKFVLKARMKVHGKWRWTTLARATSRP